MPQKKSIRDIRAARDVILGDQNNLNADLTRLEAQLEQIVALLKQSGTAIQVGGDARGAILLVGDGNTVQVQRGDPERLGRLQSGSADPARREEIYLACFILNQMYARWEREYLPLAGFLRTEPRLRMEPSLRLSDREDQGLSQAGIKVDDIRQAITQHAKTRLVILGEPGCGKTTTLNRLALDLARERLRDPLNARLPVRVDLFKFTGDQQPDDFLNNEWNKTGLAGSYGQAVASRQVCFLLDGVNQMPTADRAKRIGRWAHWANHDLQPGNWAIFTYRAADYTSSLRLPEVQVNTLDDGQMRQYFELRFGAQEAERHWATIEKRLRAGNDRFERLARNPFMLNLMADNLAEGKSFGESRALLMRDLADRLLDRELQHDGRQPEALTADPTGTAAVVLEALARLAFAMQKRSEGTGLPRALAEKTPLAERGGAKLPLDDILGLALDATLLEETDLTENGQTQPGYIFYHHLLQEYFAARRLLALFRAGKDITTYARVPWRAWQFVLQPLAKGQQMPPPPTTGWEETLTFAAALAAGRDAEKLVGQIAKVNLPLAGRCLAEIGISHISPLPLGEGPGRRTEPVEVVRADLHPLAEHTRAALLTRQRDPRAHLRARIDAGLALGELGHPDLRPQPFEFEGKTVWAILPPMQQVPAGEFIFGSDPNDKNAYDDEKTTERRQHLPAYRIGRYAVTNAEFKFFIEVGGYQDARWWSAEGLKWKQGGPDAHAAAIESWMNNRKAIGEFGVDKAAAQFSWIESRRRFWAEVTALDEDTARERARGIFERPFDRPGYWDDAALSSPARPLVGVNWHEASAYCAWLSAVSGQTFRLPTEFEWEKAARGPLLPSPRGRGAGGEGRVYPWGEKFDPSRCNSVESQIYRTVPVGLYPNGLSPFGIWEASGNIAEWTSSWYQAYPGSDTQSDDFGEKYRVCRGGSWYYNHGIARCADRFRDVPDYFNDDLGFRFVSPGS